jgi:hypothetical protein
MAVDITARIRLMVGCGTTCLWVTGFMPPLWSPNYWWRRTFNGVMLIARLLVVNDRADVALAKQIGGQVAN